MRLVATEVGWMESEREREPQRGQRVVVRAEDEMDRKPFALPWPLDPQ